MQTIEKEGADMATTDLIIIACSGAKLRHPAPALELYQGVMYSTYRANVQPDVCPNVVILSALHGFVSSDAVIEPYEQRLTHERADGIVSHIGTYLGDRWPSGAANVLFAGGSEYRRVMRAALPHLIERRHIARHAEVTETVGGIGYQRQQLGAFLRRIAASQQNIDHQPNGTPLFRTPMSHGERE